MKSLIVLALVTFGSPAFAATTTSCKQLGQAQAQGVEVIITGKKAVILKKGVKVAALTETRSNLTGLKVYREKTMINSYSIRVPAKGVIKSVAIYHGGVAGDMPSGAPLTDCKTR